MSTSAQILAAWETKIFAHESVKAITPYTFSYDLEADVGSMSEFTAGIFKQKMNFIRYLTSRTREMGELRATGGPVSRYSHTFDVDYFIEKDIAEADQNYNEAIRVIELIDDLVRSELGKSWDSTIDFYLFGELRRPQLVDIAGKKVWRVGQTYVGTKTV